jgi:RecB family exonuclease
MYEKRYSYSALSTYEQCPLKYDLSYIRKIRLPKVYSYDLVKGLLFHKYAELYKVGEKFSDHRYLLTEIFSPSDEVDASWLAKITHEEKQKIMTACKEFKEWWDSFIDSEKPKVLSREYTLTGSTPFPFTGIIDLYYEKEDGLYIVDYKTSKNAEVKYYRNQLELYTHYLKENLKKEVKGVSVYFAFAEDVKDSRLVPVKKIKPEETALHYSELIKEMTGPDRKKEANLNRLCDYCQYRGNTNYCPVSVIAGAKPPVT